MSSPQRGTRVSVKTYYKLQHVEYAIHVRPPGERWRIVARFKSEQQARQHARDLRAAIQAKERSRNA